jgi:hypothetical protein
MVLEQVDPKPVSDCDGSTIFTASSPSEGTAIDLLEDPLSPSAARFISSSVPWPGSTFVISSVFTGDVLTLRGGQVVLAPPGGRDSIHWECVESKGWFGFRNPVSGRFLGYDKSGTLCCSAKRHEGWEHFHARIRPEGGYDLLMTHWEKVWPVGIKVEQGVKKLAKIEDGGQDKIVWGFVKL